MAPFGETVLAWRLARQLTQAQLARAAGVPRPNLSAIERGDREVTVRTVRALALALEVRAGVLVDGVLPGAEDPPLDRAALERVAAAAARGTTLADRREALLAEHLRHALSARLARAGARPARARRRSDRAYLMLKAGTSDETAASLVDRAIAQRQHR